MQRIPHALRVILLSTVGLLASPPRADAMATAVGPAAAEGDMAKAEQLYLEGKAKFEMSEHVAALERWQQAYALIPDSPETKPIKNDLLYNMAKAQVKAYEVDHNVARLRKAKQLFSQYLTAHQSLHGDTDAAKKERAEVQAQLDHVDELLAGQDDGGGEFVATGSAPGDPAAGGVTEGAAPAAPTETADGEERDLDELLAANPEANAEYKKGRSMIIAGAVLGTVGILFVGGGVAVLGSETVTGTELLPRTRAVAFAGLGVGAASFITGAVLLGVGVPKLVKAKRKARGELAGVSPWVTGQGAGATLVVRF